MFHSCFFKSLKKKMEENTHFSTSPVSFVHVDLNDLPGMIASTAKNCLSIFCKEPLLSKKKKRSCNFSLSGDVCVLLPSGKAAFWTSMPGRQSSRRRVELCTSSASAVPAETSGLCALRQFSRDVRISSLSLTFSTPAVMHRCGDLFAVSLSRVQSESGRAVRGFQQTRAVFRHHLAAGLFCRSHSRPCVPRACCMPRGALAAPGQTPPSDFS